MWCEETFKTCFVRVLVQIFFIGVFAYTLSANSNGMAIFNLLCVLLDMPSIVSWSNFIHIVRVLQPMPPVYTDLNNKLSSSASLINFNHFLLLPNKHCCHFIRLLKCWKICFNCVSQGHIHLKWVLCASLLKCFWVCSLSGKTKQTPSMLLKRTQGCFWVSSNLNQ